ncbi:transposase [Candidatus Microgenomates bacterium]|nr:transposase [Candidatus Microgenomates bacterium]
MLNQEYLLKHRELFQYVIGITFSQFQKLLPKFTGVLRQAEIKKAYSRKRLREIGGGRKAKLADDYQKLFFILFYYKTYPTFRFAQVIYGLDKRNIQLWVKFLASVLFSTLGYELTLKVRKRISRWDLWLEEYPELAEFIIDCTERLIQRPKDNRIQQEHYSGKKKAHCIKNQILVSPQTNRILSVSPTLPGTIHDKKIFDYDPAFLRAPPDSVGMGDSAYQGADGNNSHLKMVIPKKKPPGGELSQEEKAANRTISSIRVRVEHSLSYLKHFGILNQKFRGRITNQQNLDLPIQTIACIYNFTRVPT